MIITLERRLNLTENKVNITHPIDGRAPTLQAIPKEKDRNHSGDIFGGWILAQMDIAGGARAFQEVKGRVVTVAVESMAFKRPVFKDDLVCFYTKVHKIGNTSITIDIEAWSNRSGSQELLKVTEGFFTFVALDENKKPTKIVKG